jgi:hypothetical protein
MLLSLSGFLKTPLDRFEKLPYSENNLEALHILVDHEFARFIYDPIIHQAGHHEAPSWCIAFVDLLKYVFQFKEWTHTMNRQSVEEFEWETPLSFLIYTNMCLECMDIEVEGNL